MLTSTRAKVSALALAIAAVVAALTVAEAIRQDDLGPIWATAWLPAVFAGAYYRPGASRCRRARS